MTHQIQLSTALSLLVISIFPTLGTMPGTQEVLCKCMLEAQCLNTEREPPTRLEEAAHRHLVHFLTAFPPYLVQKAPYQRKQGRPGTGSKACVCPIYF